MIVHGTVTLSSCKPDDLPMEIKLTPKLKRFVEQKVQSGDYASPDEVIGAALCLLDGQADRIEALRRALDPAIAEFERGEIIPGPLAVEQAAAEFRELMGSEQR